MKLKNKIKVIDQALKEHYRLTMDAKRVPSDYMCMFTEGGETLAVADAVETTVLEATSNYLASELKKCGEAARVRALEKGIILDDRKYWAGALFATESLDKLVSLENLTEVFKDK